LDPRCRVELLGGLRAIRDGCTITRFSTQKTAALLAYLAFYQHRPHPREVLAELLWPERPPKAGRDSLNTALSSLRRQLEPPGVPRGAVLQADRVAVQLNPLTVQTDVAEFEAALRAAVDARSAAERARWLIEAVALYRGELLPGHYDDWIGPEQQRLSDRLIQALTELARYREQEADYPSAIEYACRAVAAAPLREEVHRDLIRVYAAAGQVSAALRQYGELERVLRAELGCTPSAATRRLMREIEAREGVEEWESGRVGERRARRRGDAETRGHSDLGRGGSEPGGPGAASPTPQHPNTSTPQHLNARTPERLNAQRSTLPPGALTFLLTDIEGSTALWEREGAAFEAALVRHHALLREKFRKHNGVELKETGDSFLVAFAHAGDALACAVSCQRAFAEWNRPPATENGRATQIRVRMALHTGDVQLRDGEYYGLTLHRASRVLLAAHGGQILCSEATAGLIRPGEAWAAEPGVRLVDLGVYRLRDLPSPERLFQVEYPGMTQREFPRLRAEAGSAGNLPVRFTRFFGREEELARLEAILVGGSVGSVGGEGSLTSHTPHTSHTSHPPPTRLVTLTGAGGSGKTRLALEAASRLTEAYRGAVWFVPLADLPEPSLLPGAVADALRLPRLAGAEPVEQIAELLRGYRALLVLDNFEHLVEEGAPLVWRLLERIPTLTCLVTSRRLLQLPGERELQVAPLPVLQEGMGKRGNGEMGKAAISSISPFPFCPEELLRFPSVQLFVDRAQAVRPDFQVTRGNTATLARLCERLEGLPLALELAAARAQVLTPAQMLSQLERRFEFLVSRHRVAEERHRTLRAAIEWSYRLLDPDLQRVFCHLSVFRGGWTLEAAEAVVSGQWSVVSKGSEFGVQGSGEGNGQWSPPAPRIPGSGQRGRACPTHHPPTHHSPTHYSPLTTHQTLEALEQLREWSLVLAEDGEAGMRFRMLESLRDYASAQLQPEERGLVERHHAEYYLALAEQARPDWKGTGQAAWLQRLEPEQDNLRAALAWAAGSGEGDLCARLSLAFYPLLYHRGEWSEARRCLETGLEAIGRWDGDLRPLRAKLESELAGICLDMGDLEEARQRAGATLDLCRELGDEAGMADALNLMGVLHMNEGELGAAGPCFQEALRLRADAHGRAVALHNLARLATQRGDATEARRLYEEALVHRHAAGDARGQAETLQNLGTLAHASGDYEDARRLYQHSLGLYSEVRYPYGVAMMLSNLGELAELAGSVDVAISLYVHAERLLRDLQSRYACIPAEALERLGQQVGDQCLAEQRLAAERTTWESILEFF
jgi:predicted ATPase/DNA-binding SARP family transcriptional activator/class 3 adenylate cyclase